MWLRKEEEAEACHVLTTIHMQSWMFSGRCLYKIQMQTAHILLSNSIRSSVHSRNRSVCMKDDERVLEIHKVSQRVGEMGVAYVE